MRRTTTQSIKVLRRVNEFHVDNATAGQFGPVDTDVRERFTALRTECLRPIARTALVLYPRASSDLAGFRMPSRRSNDHLIAAAIGMAERAEGRKVAFIEAGLGDDFVERLHQMVSALRTALEEQANQLGRRVAATARVDAESARPQAHRADRHDRDAALARPGQPGAVEESRPLHHRDRAG
ncbi:MAG: hypothetical protein H7066_12865 [Cytophagaceae bacterium]|nr:hypothetical protein [Gemmatimonadaceae bacterium]